VRPLAGGDWPAIERLFGANGACAGCWCMYWRIEKGPDWLRAKGKENERAFRRLVRAGRVFGCLAFAGKEPVGWCCLGPRRDFPRLLVSRAIRTDAGPEDWAIVCFFVRSGWRRRGVARSLVAAAVRLAKRHGARLLDAYPVQTKADGSYPAAFAWTGVPAMFAGEGFVDATPNGSRRIVLRARAARPRG
jgi:GNAT superfamily N-acetyltransferase